MILMYVSPRDCISCVFLMGKPVIKMVYHIMNIICLSKLYQWVHVNTESMDP